MARYEFPSMVAKDPTLDVTVRDGSGLVYAILDTAFTSPLPVYDRYGSVKSTVNTTSEGQTEEFYVDNYPVVWWKSGSWAFLISSYTGMLAATEAALASALASEAAARAAQLAAELAASNAAAPLDAAMASAVNGSGTATRGAIEAIVAALGMVQRTADTNEDYKALLYADGTVRAVPRGTVAPAVPANLVATPNSTSAKLTWNVAAGATSYVIYRDGVQLTTTTATSYRDNVGRAGGTYSYQVAAVNNYNMHSAKTSAVSAFLDPALNVAPALTITTWPLTIPTTGRCIVRINATDVDAQTLSYTLNVSAGSLQPTADPSVWILTL